MNASKYHKKETEMTNKIDYSEFQEEIQDSIYAETVRNNQNMNLSALEPYSPAYSYGMYFHNADIEDRSDICSESQDSSSIPPKYNVMKDVLWEQSSYYPNSIINSQCVTPQLSTNGDCMMFDSFNISPEVPSLNSLAANIPSTMSETYNSDGPSTKMDIDQRVNMGEYLNMPNMEPKNPKFITRPELDAATVERLNDISEFLNNKRYSSLLIKYSPLASFQLGEGGRELLRACLNLRGCKGKQLQGASVPVLLELAYKWNLWNVALRVHIERTTNEFCYWHDAFVKFKAEQSQMRKYVRREYMVTERDRNGRISSIIYEENRRIILGKEGREALRTQLRRMHEKYPVLMDEVLERHGFRYAELRNATVHQLSRMAFICNLWDKVVHACRNQEEKNESLKKRRGHLRSSRVKNNYSGTQVQKNYKNSSSQVNKLPAVNGVYALLNDQSGNSSLNQKIDETLPSPVADVENYTTNNVYSPDHSTTTTDNMYWGHDYFSGDSEMPLNFNLTGNDYNPLSINNWSYSF